MRIQSMSHMAALACGVSTLIVPAIARAQEKAAEAAPMSGNEIVVTATRETTTVQKTPMAVEVVTGAQVQKLNIFDTKELQSLSPGLELANSTGRSNTATLRGIAFDPDGGTSPAVEVFYNEISVNANTVFTAIYDLDQIEVLRGPQGLFRGRTSPAGALLFSTRRANLSRAEGYAQVAGTTENGVNIQSGVSVPLIEDKLAIRVSGLYDRNHVSGVTTVDGRESRNRTYSGRVSVAIRPVENWTTNIMYQHLDAKLTPYIAAFGPGNTVGGVRTGPALTISDRKSVVEGPKQFDNKTDLVTLNSTYDFGSFSLVGNFGYQYTRLKQLHDLDVGNAIPNYVSTEDLFTSFKNKNAELRLQSNGDRRLSWAVSADYHDNYVYSPLHEDLTTFTPAGVIDGPCIPDLGNACYRRASIDLSIKSKGWGASGTIGYGLTDSLKLTAGIRYSSEKVVRDQELVLNPITGGGFPLGAFTDPDALTYPNGDWQVFLPLCSNFGPGSPFFQAVDFYRFNPVGTKPFINIDPAGTCGLGLEPTHIVSRPKLWSGGANLAWQINPDVNAYASYGRTRRSGPPAVAQSADVGAQYLLAKDETSDGFEVGVKAYLLDRKMNLNVAVFYQKFKNFLSYDDRLFAIEPSGHVTVVQVPTNGNAEVKGIEMQLGYRPTSNIDLGLNASWADSKYTSPVYCSVFDANGNPVLPPAPANTTSGIPQTATCVGRPLSDSPKFTATLNGEARIPIDANVTPFIRGNANFRPAFDSTISNYHYPVDLKIDMSMGIRSNDSNWELTAFVKNLLNQDRVRKVSPNTYRVQATDGSFINSGYRTATINAPREFGLSARYSF